MWGGQDRSGARKPYGNSMQNLDKIMEVYNRPYQRRRSPSPPRNRGFRPEDNNSNNNVETQSQKERRYKLITRRGPVDREDMLLKWQLDQGHWRPSDEFLEAERRDKAEVIRRTNAEVEAQRARERLRAQEAERQRKEIEEQKQRVLNVLRNVCAQPIRFDDWLSFDECSAPDMDGVIEECEFVICENENELRIMNFA